MMPWMPLACTFAREWLDAPHTLLVHNLAANLVAQHFASWPMWTISFTEQQEFAYCTVKGETGVCLSVLISSLA
jgi:hypothetical protein